MSKSPKTLLIVESPAKIKTISKFLGSHVVVMSTVGHVKDLPPKKLGISITDKAITFEYVTLEKKDKVLKELRKAARQASLILLAPDPDREGELIAWHVAQEVAQEVKDPSCIKRITFNEITKSAIEEAIKHPGSVDLKKVEAQQARRALDRWVGYKVSPVLWQKIRKGLSAGRVQSVALRLICDREVAIKSFIPQESWSIEVLCGWQSYTITLTLTHIKKKRVELTKEAQARKVVDDLQKASLAISSITDTIRKKKPYAPFTTSTLQQAAYQQLNFKVSRTMEIAQQLYEGIPLKDEQGPVALITYMRTDSTRISDSALKDVRAFVKKAYGEKYLPAKAHLYMAKKKGQDAHEAIRPIDSSITPESVARYLEPAQHKLYALIWKRFVACQMSEAEYAQRKVVVEGNGFTLSATGTTPLFDGFRKVYVAQEEEAEASTPLPADMKEGTALGIVQVTPKQHFTQPPARFSEASLVKELEKEGIGRPSTYATILKTIQLRSYTELDDKKRFVPTDLGKAVTKLLVENLPKIMSLSFTAEMETDLDKIAHNEMARDTLLRDFYTTFSQDLASFEQHAGVKPLEVTTITCPSCKEHALVVRFGKAGPFVGCPGYPSCSFTSNFTRTPEGVVELAEAPVPIQLNEDCPQCKKPLRQIVGRFGPFISCSGYPDCTYIKQEKAPFSCPRCGNEIIKRQWRGKLFWGCSGYPGCKFSISGEIKAEPCPQCKAPYLRVKQTEQETVLFCADSKGCGYKLAER